MSGIIGKREVRGSGIVNRDTSLVTSVSGSTGVVADSDIDHDSLANFAANEHYTQANITALGTVTSGTLGSGVTGTGLRDAIMYRKVADQTAGSYPVPGWEAADDQANEFYLGGSATALVSESSGFFTMEQTGYILIMAHISVHAADWCYAVIEATTTGSTSVGSGFTKLCRCDLDSDSQGQSGYLQCIVKTTTTANNNKFFIRWDGGAADFTLQGGSAGAMSETTILFLKLADL